MEFEEYYEEAREDINDKLIEVLGEKAEDKDMHEIFHAGIEGGKRFRPTLTLLTFDMLGGQNRERALTHSSIIELIHEASLIQDDALDYDKTRRGKDSIWVRMMKKSMRGLAKVFPDTLPGELNPKVISAVMSDNILIGDGLLAMALRLIEDPEILKAFSEGIYALSKGAFEEADTYLSSKLFGSSEDRYMRIIRGKTASLFYTATYVGAISADAEGEEKSKAKEMGMYLGICYQIADDLSEGDVPSNVDAKKLLLKYADEFDEMIRAFPRNEYRDMFITVLPYMVNKLLKEQEFPKYIAKSTKNGYMWVDNNEAKRLGIR